MASAELSSNRILRALPAASLKGIAPLFKVRRFAPGTVLQDSDAEITHCYFPMRGIASMVVTEASGKSVDTAIIGPEGFVGLPVFLGTEMMPVQTTAQLELQAAEIAADDLRRCLADEPELSSMIQRYTQMVLVELARLVLCNRVHALEDRIARWLLQVHDRVNSELPMDVTHEFLAEMLGSHRPSVTIALSRLAQAGVITMARGTIAVSDAAGLEGSACDCYRTIRDEFDRLLEEPSRHEVAG